MVDKNEGRSSLPRFSVVRVVLVKALVRVRDSSRKYMFVIVLLGSGSQVIAFTTDNVMYDEIVFTMVQYPNRSSQCCSAAG